MSASACPGSGPKTTLTCPKVYAKPDGGIERRRGGLGLIARPEFHIDMGEPEIVVGFAGRFEAEASVEGDEMDLGGQRDGQSRMMLAAE